MIMRRPLRIIDALLVVMFLACVLMTNRAFHRAPPAPPAPPAATPPAPLGAGEAGALEEEADRNPEKTMLGAVESFFKDIARKRYEEASSMFSEETQRKSWLDSLRRVERYGNPIVGYEIENAGTAGYCRLEAGSVSSGKCELPILIHRRDAGVSEWATLKIDLVKVGDRWRFLHYVQEKTERETKETAASEPVSGEENRGPAGP